MKKKTMNLSIIGWKEFSTLKDGTRNVRLTKSGNTISFQFRYKRKWYELFYLRQAKSGEGMMDWGEYKERTERM